MRAKAKGKSISRTQLVSDAAAYKIVRIIDRLKKAFASFLTERTKNYSDRKWKILILLFAALWGGLSLYVFKNAITGHSSVIAPTQIRMVAKPVSSDSLVLMENIYKQKKVSK